MNKILFLDDRTYTQLVAEVNNELKIKNRLVKLLLENEHHKLSLPRIQQLLNQYNDQIFILESIGNYIPTVKNRDDIDKLNSMIDEYKRLELEVDISRNS